MLIADTLTANYANNRGCSAGNAAKPVYNVVVDRELAAPLVARQAKGGFTDPVNDNIIAFSSQDYGNDATFDLSPTLRALNHDKSHINGGGQIAIIQHASIGRKNDAGPQGKGWRDDGKSWTLDSRGTSDIVAHSSIGARRLTPTECERLQGFPDNFTAMHSDSVRYHQLGNAVAVPVAEWIGKRIASVLESST